MPRIDEPGRGKIVQKKLNLPLQTDSYNKALVLVEVDEEKNETKLDDEKYELWWKKGQAFTKLERYHEAAYSYERAISLTPPSPDNYVIYREYGSLLEKIGQLQRSILMYKISLKYEPRYRASNYERRLAYKKMYFGVANL